MSCLDHTFKHKYTFIPAAIGTCLVLSNILLQWPLTPSMSQTNSSLHTFFLCNLFPIPFSLCTYTPSLLKADSTDVLQEMHTEGWMTDFLRVFLFIFKARRTSCNSSFSVGCLICLCAHI